MDLFVSDLDGTLLQPNAALSQQTKELLNESISAGKLFTVATARTPATVEPILQGINLQLPAIVMTGAALWNIHTFEYLDLDFMKSATAAKLIETYNAAKCPIFLYTVVDGMINIYHLGGKLSALEEKFMRERLTTPFKRFYLSEDGDEILPPNLDQVILFYGMQPDSISRAAYEATLSIPDCRPQFYYDIYGPEIGIVEAFAGTATKAEAIRKVKDMTGANRVIAFGDNLNDIPMLREADVAVAVANALPEVKAIADIVIGPNTEDSVAKFIKDWDVAQP